MMEGEVRFRKVRLDDQSRVEEITRGLFGGQDYVASSLPKWVSVGFFYCLADAATDSLMACVNLVVDNDFAYAYVAGLRVASEARSKGLGTKLIQQVWAIHPELELMTYTTFTTNVASIKVAQRADFIPLDIHIPYASLSPEHLQDEPYNSLFKSSNPFQDWVSQLQQSLDMSHETMVKLADAESAHAAIAAAVPDVAFFINQWDLTPATPASMAKSLSRPETEVYVCEKEPCVVSVGSTEEKTVGKVQFVAFYASSGDEDLAIARHAIHWVQKAQENGCTTMMFFLIRQKDKPDWNEKLFGYFRALTVLSRKR